jgi:hypothetical protein
LQDDRAKLTKRPNQFGGEGVDAFNSLHLRVQRGGGLEFKIG